MAFNRSLARELLRKTDRDVAPHFAGRAREISEFNEALIASREEPDACIFRIFQGAPGCGKTSLVRHLKKTREEDCIFASIANDDLTSRDVLYSAILREMDQQSSQLVKFGAASIDVLSELFKMRKSGERLNEFVKGAGYKNTVDSKYLVLHMDEAQMISPDAQRVLSWLHTSGLSLPCVFLFTGLNHTESAIRGLGGLSRLGKNVTVQMGAMATEECAECTNKMMLDLQVRGAVQERDAAASAVASLSYGWPQHLKIANDALCSELLRTNGVLKEVDFERVEEESRWERARYYQARLENSVLEVDDWRFTYYVVNAIGTKKPKTTSSVEQITDDVLTKLQFSDRSASTRYRNSDAVDFADALIRRGVVSQKRDGIFDVSIPSFATWLRDSTAERRRNDRQEIVPDLGR